MIVLKTSTDRRTGMTVRRVNLDGAKFRIFGEWSLTAQQMYQLGLFAIAVMRERVSRGIGSSDAPMKPLSEHKGRRWSKSRGEWVEYGRGTGYRFRKVRSGGKGIRDLTLTGSMLGNISVRSVSERQVRIDITSSRERMKARANEIRSPWWGWSANDLARITLAARQLFRLNIGEISVGGRGGAMFGGSAAIWMNPWQHNAPASRDAAWASGLRTRIATGGFRRAA
jgi:hypothetical protein